MSDCICISLRQASRRLTAYYDELLAPAGISLTQFSMLRSLSRVGPSSLTALAAIVELDRSTLGRNMRVLERGGLVSMTPGHDQREATLRLTDAGGATLTRATPLWEKAQRGVVKKLGLGGESELAALLSAL